MAPRGRSLYGMKPVKMPVCDVGEIELLIRQFPDFRRRRRNVKPSVIGGSGVKLNG
jgi:hypothetical protein